MTDPVVYKLYSHRPLSTAANQQLAVSTGTIATYFGNLAPLCGCLHAEVHELCVRALSADISARRRWLHIKPSSQYATQGYAVRCASRAYYVRNIVNICRRSARPHRADAARHRIDRIDFYPRVSTRTSRMTSFMDRPMGFHDTTIPRARRESQVEIWRAELVCSRI